VSVLQGKVARARARLYQLMVVRHTGARWLFSATQVDLRPDGLSFCESHVGFSKHKGVDNVRARAALTQI
jgi:hypothetical protein